MHDYTASKFHDGRMRDLTQAADAYRLATTAKAGRTRRGRWDPRRWLSFAQLRVRFAARRFDPAGEIHELPVEA